MKFPSPSYLKRELINGSYSGANRPALIIRGQEGLLELLRYVENHIATLHQAETASNCSDAALAQLQEARFDIRALIRRAETLLQELDWEI